MASNNFSEVASNLVDVLDEEAIESVMGVAEKNEEVRDVTVEVVDEKEGTKVSLAPLFGFAVTVGSFVTIADDSVEEEGADNIGEAFTEASSTLIVTYSDNQSL